MRTTKAAPLAPNSYSKNWRHEQAQGVRRGSRVDIAEPLNADLAHTEEAEAEAVAGPWPLVDTCPGGPRRRRRVAPSPSPPSTHSYSLSQSRASASPCFVLRLFCASPRPRLSTPGRRIADPRRSLQRPPTPPRFRGTHPRHIHSSHPPSAAPFACLRLRPGSLPFARPARRDPWEARSRSRSRSRSLLAALPYCCRTAHAHAYAHGDTDSPPVTAARLHELLPDTPSPRPPELQ